MCIYIQLCREKVFCLSVRLNANLVTSLVVRLTVGASTRLIVHGLDFSGFDQVLNFVTWLTPVALTGPLLLDSVWSLAEMAIVGEETGVCLGFAVSPFVCSCHDVVFVV